MFQIADYVWHIVAFDLLLGALALWALPAVLARRWQMPETADWRLLGWKPMGVVFGKQGFKYVRKGEEQDGHILVLGGSGSGKTSCLAVPSLLSWRSAAFAVDIKGELYQKTRWKRRRIKAFNPLDKNAYGYNPFYLLDQSDNPVSAARQIVLALIDQPADMREPFWVQASQNLFTGCILHFYQKGRSFIQTVEAIQDLPPADLIGEIAKSQSVYARRFVSQFVGMDVKTIAGVYSELSNKLAVFATDPLLQDCLSRERCIRPDDLEEGSDVYLLLPEDKLEAWRGLLALIVNQFLRHFERRQEGDSPLRPILFLLDEFPRLGKVDAVKGLATLRSRKVTICLLVQSLAQLDFLYGKSYRQVIADNCAYKAVLNATDAETQEYFSRLVGTADRLRQTNSTSFRADGRDIAGTGRSETAVEKRLVKPEEFATLRDVVLLSPHGYCRIRKTSCYRERAFREPRAAAVLRQENREN
jgi:type IV secretion system protein VirD4